MAAAGAERGRKANTPWQIPKTGWKDAAQRMRGALGRDHVGLVAAGCAFYALLALFPALAAIVAVWGLAADPGQAAAQISGFTGALPPEAAAIIEKQAASAAAADRGAALAAALTILLALFSASKGVRSLSEGLNIVYDEMEGRGFIAKILVNLGLTFGAVLGVVAAMLLVVAVPAVIDIVGLEAGAKAAARFAKWTILAGGAVLAFGALYRYGPHRADAQLAWLLPGALFGVLLWLSASALFSVYVAHFASYNATYGALGSVVILLMWLYLTAFCVLLGAELNAALEGQTGRDTTTGPAQPRGTRGAVVADAAGAAEG